MVGLDDLATAVRPSEAASTASPVPDPSGVDMHEVGRLIVADSADLQRLRRVAQVLEPDARHTDVDRLPLDVHAVGRDAAVRAAPLLQHGVRFRRAVARDHVKRLIGAEARIQGKQQIEQFRVDGLDDVDAKVAQEMIQITERAGDVFARRTIRGREPLLGVRVEERQ